MFHNGNQEIFAQVRKVRGVLGNKCAGQHNLKALHFKETIVSGNF
jgi:hypothetical protein